MTGYVKTCIDFEALQKDLDAAKAVSEAGHDKSAKDILSKMKTKLEEESK